MSIAYYLLKVALCSGLLTGYYFLALRNRLFHQWNRFYLLAAVLLSLSIPLLEFRFLQTIEEPLPAIEMVGVVQGADMIVERWQSEKGFKLSWENLAGMAYAATSFVLLFMLFLALFRIFRLAKSHSYQQLNSVRFYVVEKIKGTPFSFFSRIFWNPEIDLHTEQGRKILEHEMVHVQENHSADKLLMQTVLAFFWVNPFFWLIRKELYAIHEFLADRKAVRNGDASLLAAMILQASYPQQYNSLTQSFFTSSIKRRIRMLTQLQNPKVSYAGRIAALPLMALLVMAFTFKTEKLIPLEEPIVVMIDAGHGKMDNGKYNGAYADGVYEDEITMALTKKIAELNSNPDIKIVFTRNSERIVGLHDRVNLTREAKADLFISMHVGADAVGDKTSGIEILTSSKNTPFQQQSDKLAAALITNLKSVYTVMPNIRKRQVGVWVMDQAPCPSVLIECGYLTNPTDRAFITVEKNQKAIAEKILAAIEQYAQQKQTSVGLSRDTLPEKKGLLDPVVVQGKKVAAVDVRKPIDKIIITYTDGSCETMTEREAIERKLLTPQAVMDMSIKFPKNAENREIYIDGGTVDIKTGITDFLIIINGEEASKKEMNALNPNNIASIDVLKGASATELYGKKGANGVLVIKTKAAADNKPVEWRQNGSEAGTMKLEKIAINNSGDIRVNVTEMRLKTSDEQNNKSSNTNLNEVVVSVHKNVNQKTSDSLMKVIEEYEKEKPANDSGVVTVTGYRKANKKITSEQLRKMSLHQLAGVSQTDEIVGLNLSTDKDNGDIIEATISGSKMTTAGQNLLDVLKPGKILFVERIIVKRNGEMKKMPAKVYQL